MSIHKSKRVLLVEDEPLVQKIHLSMLQEIDCHADIASTGESAVELASEHYYDIILMDIHLPKISGIDAARKIRLTKSSKSYIVALTASFVDEIRDLCINAGINIVESKPISSARLQQICCRTK